MSTIIYLLQVTACTAVFYLFYFLFLSRLTFFTTNRWYLLVTIVLSFLIPWLRITLNEQQPYVAAVQHMIYVPQTMPPALETQMVVQQAPVVAEPIHWDAILKMAYFAMAGALGIHLLVTLLSFLKHIKGKRIAKIGKVNVLSGQQKLANGSFLNYIFLNEDELSPDEIAQIIAHEMLHIKLYHSADRILVKIAQILLWFNPFIYLYARSVEENHEFEVDREIARSTDKHNYANLLLHLSVAGRGMLYHNFSKVPLKKRISMLFNKPSNKMKKITYVLIVPVVLISCLAFARLKKADANNIDSTQIAYKQKIKRTRAETIRYKKQQDDWKKYQQTDDYKNKMKLMDDIAGKTINVTVKGTIPNKIYPNKQGVILAVYNGHEFAIDSRYGQGKTLFNLIKPGDQITLKVFESVVRADYPVMITPAYVIKNKVKIFQLAEADKIPDYPFLYEANKVRFTEGQVSNIVKYPNGKWRSALFETVNGYKFNLNFKQSAPDLNSIEDGDHVRLRFVHEVKTGAKTYRINDWVSITTNIKDYGIKNPELFSRFYSQTNITEAKYSAANDSSKTEGYLRANFGKKTDGVLYSVTCDSSKNDTKHQILYFYHYVHFTCGDFETNADFVKVDIKNHLVFASGRIEPIAKRYEGSPVFKTGEGGQSITSDSLLFRDKTKELHIWKGSTEQDLIIGASQKSNNYKQKEHALEFAYKNILVNTSDLPFPDTHFSIVVTKPITESNGIMHQSGNIAIDDKSGINTPLIIPYGFEPKKNM